MRRAILLLVLPLLVWAVFLPTRTVVIRGKLPGTPEPETPPIPPYEIHPNRTAETPSDVRRESEDSPEDVDIEPRHRAIAGLSARDDRVAEAAVAILSEPVHAELRYEAYRALVAAGREGLVSDLERERLFREYEMSVGR